MTSLVLATTSCVSSPDERDPLEPLNRVVYVFNGVIDSIFIKTAAGLYSYFLPPVIREPISKVIANATYLDTVLNGLLQGKFAQSGSDMGRFLVNTTVGIGGLFDPATGIGLEQHDEDFGKTLAGWGAGSGPYVVVPIFGPSTLRDLPSMAVSYLSSPIPWVDDTGAKAAMWAAYFVDDRSRVDADFEQRNREAADPYAFTREAWLRHRAFAVSGGEPEAEQAEARELLKEVEELDALDLLDELEALDEQPQADVDAQR